MGCRTLTARLFLSTSGCSSPYPLSPLPLITFPSTRALAALNPTRAETFVNLGI